MLAFVRTRNDRMPDDALRGRCAKRLRILAFCANLALSWAPFCNARLAVTSSNADLVVLRGLYQALQGQSWMFPPGAQPWSFTSPASHYCHWYGVYCCPDANLQVVRLWHAGVAITCNSPGEVVALELPDMHLQGRLPAWEVLRSLRSLAVLNVSLNQDLQGDMSGLASSGAVPGIIMLDIRGTDISAKHTGDSGMLVDGLNMASNISFVDGYSPDNPCLAIRCQALLLSRPQPDTDPTNSSEATVILASHGQVPPSVCTCPCAQYTADGQGQCYASPPFTASNIAYIVMGCLLHVTAVSSVAYLLVRFTRSVVRKAHIHVVKGSHAPGGIPPSQARIVTGHASPHVTMVMTDVEGSTKLWEWNAPVMAAAISMHDSFLRRMLRRCYGYEVTTERDAFIVAFHSATDAVEWAMAVQEGLMHVPWPEELLQRSVLPCAAPVEQHGRHIFRGLRVRMAMESGPLAEQGMGKLTGQLKAEGPFVPVLEAMADVGNGGQCIMGQRCMRLYTETIRGKHPLRRMPYLRRYLQQLPRASATDWSSAQMLMLQVAPPKNLQSQLSPTHGAINLLAPLKAAFASQTSLQSLSPSASITTPASPSEPGRPTEFVAPAQSARRPDRTLHTLAASLVGAASCCVGRRSAQLQGLVQRPWREASEAWEVAQVLQGRPRGRRLWAAVLLMHMGDFSMAVNPIHEGIMTAAYQALPAALAVRAFYMARSLPGLGREGMPSFLNHPLVTAKSAALPEALLNKDRPEATWPHAAVVLLQWPERPDADTPLAAAVSHAVILCIQLCAARLGGYVCEAFGGRWLMVFRRAGAAVQFSADVQRVLRQLRWDNFEGDVQGLWRVPRVSFCPCIRTAVDVVRTDGPTLLSPASGRAVPAGPHIRRLLELVLTAAPAEVVLTQTAVNTWRDETLVSSLDGGNPFAHVRTTPNPLSSKEANYLLRNRLFSVSPRGSFEGCFSAEQNSIPNHSSSSSRLIDPARPQDHASSSDTFAQMFSCSDTGPGLPPQLVLHSGAPRSGWACSDRPPPSLLSSLNNLHSASEDTPLAGSGDNAGQAAQGQLPQDSAPIEIDNRLTEQSGVLPGSQRALNKPPSIVEARPAWLRTPASSEIPNSVQLAEVHEKEHSDSVRAAAHKSPDMPIPPQGTRPQQIHDALRALATTAATEQRPQNAPGLAPAGAHANAVSGTVVSGNAVRQELDRAVVSSPPCPGSTAKAAQPFPASGPRAVAPGVSGGAAWSTARPRTRSRSSCSGSEQPLPVFAADEVEFHNRQVEYSWTSGSGLGIASCGGCPLRSAVGDGAALGSKLHEGPQREGGLVGEGVSGCRDMPRGRGGSGGSPNTSFSPCPHPAIDAGSGQRRRVDKQASVTVSDDSMHTVNSRAPSVRFCNSLIVTPAAPAARRPSRVRTVSTSSFGSLRRTWSASSVGSQGHRQGHSQHACSRYPLALPWRWPPRRAATAHPGAPPSLLTTKPSRRWPPQFCGGSAQGLQGSRGNTPGRLRRSALLTVGRDDPEDVWPPRTAWPQAAPPGSSLPGQAAFMDPSYKWLLREAALRPGLFLVYEGARARGATGDGCTYSVWTGDLLSMRKLLRVKPGARAGGKAAAAAAAAHIVYCPPSDLSSVVSSIGNVLREALVAHGADESDEDGLGSVDTPVWVDRRHGSQPGEATVAALRRQPPPESPPAAAGGSVGTTTTTRSSSMEQCDVVSIGWTPQRHSRSHTHDSAQRHSRSRTHGTAQMGGKPEEESPVWPPGAELQAYLEMQEQLELLAASGETG
eukprot:jgi/Ulvmu1/2564/UM014_0015.1